MATQKSWRDLYNTGDNDDKYISRSDSAAFYGVGGGQTPYVITSVDADIVNAIEARGNRHGRSDFVATFKDVPIDYFASPGVKMVVDRNDMVFSSETLKDGQIAFEVTPGSTGTIQGVIVRCSGYFCITIDDPGEVIGTPFTAVPLVEEVNTFSMGELQKIYPPGAYIFHLSGFAGVAFDMKSSYTVDEGRTVKQLPGVHKLQIMLMETADQGLSLMFYRKIGDRKYEKTAVFDLVGYDRLDGRKKPQQLVTHEALKTILGSIFVGADQDPTGEGTVYLPWKMEQWQIPAPALRKPTYDLPSAAVAVVNAAPRSTKNGLNIYAAQILAAPVNKDFVSPAIDCYADGKVKFSLDDNQIADGKKQIKVKLSDTAPADSVFYLLPDSDTLGFRDVEIQTNGYFQVIFTLANNIGEQVRQKIVSAQDSTGNALVLEEGENTIDKDSIYPPGTYVFRPYDPAGVKITLLASTTIGGQKLTSPDNAWLGINSIRLLGDTETFNVWFNNDGDPAKIVNDTDHEDIRESLDGMRQLKPVLMKDIGLLIGRVTEPINRRLTELTKKVDGLSPSAPQAGIWKIEQYLDGNKTLYYVTYGADGGVISALSADSPPKKVELVDGKLPSGFIRVPTLIEEELKNDPDDTPENVVADMQNAMDEMERHSGFYNYGDTKGSMSIDWSTGKLRRLILLTDNLTVNFTKPPATPMMFELFVSRSPNMSGDDRSITIVDNPITPFTGTVPKVYKPSPSEGRHIRFFYDGKKYYVDDIKF